MMKTTIARYATSVNASKSKKKVNCAVYGCGLSASGALAIPRFVQSTSSSNNEAPVTAKEAKFPKRITYFNTENIRSISSGFGFSLFGSKSKLYGAGLNNRFQIGGNVANLDDKKGQDYYISAKKVNISPISGEILGISSGRAHSLILTTNGVFGIGDNCFGQCGIDPEVAQTSVGIAEQALQKINIDTDHPITSIHCSLDTSFVINSIGEVFAFGLNEDGQCANEKYGIQWKPTKIRGDAASSKIKSISGSTDTIMAISEDKNVFIWGQTEYSQAAEASDDIQLNVSRHICKSKNVGKVISAGSSSTSCIVANENGEVFVWGVGVLGFGPSIEKLAGPTRMDQPLFDNRKVFNVFAGNSTMAATNDDGRLFVWGENRFASLGLGHEKRQLFPYQVFLPGDVKDVALGPDHSLFLVN